MFGALLHILSSADRAVASGSGTGVDMSEKKKEAARPPTMSTDAAVRGPMRPRIMATPDGIVMDGHRLGGGELAALCGSNPEMMLGLFHASLHTFEQTGALGFSCQTHGPVMDLMIICRDLFLTLPGVMRLDGARNAWLCQLLAGPGDVVQRLRVERANVLIGSGDFLLGNEPGSLLRRFRVEFEGEAALDAGGVFMEWVRVFTNSFLIELEGCFSDRDGLAEISEDGGQFLLEKEGGVYTRYYEVLGVFLAIAFQHGLRTPFRFPSLYYAKLLNQKLTSLEEIEKEDPVLYNSLEFLTRMDKETLTGLELEMPDEDGVGTVVSPDNVERLIIHKINSLDPRIAQQFAQLKAGFNRLLPAEFLGPRITYLDLKLAMYEDNERISVDDLRANTEIRWPLTPASDRVTWFWNVVSTLNDEELRSLLAFVTATEAAPLGGFAKLEPRFTIVGFGDETSPFELHRLPTAHTCFNSIDLPHYPDEATLRRLLLVAINADPSMGTK